MANSHLELGGFVKSDKSYNHPNLQFHFFPYLVINHGLENPNFEAFQFHVCPNRPKSRGFVKINSNDAKEAEVMGALNKGNGISIFSCLNLL